MDKYHLHWYTDEISIHAASAIASYGRLLHLVGNHNTRQSRDVWIALVSFLVHTAMISKFLHPVKGAEAKQRGETIQAHLEVEQSSPILPRAARDNLEHFDERIDNWVQKQHTKILEMVCDDREGFRYITERECAIRRILIAKEMVFISEDKNGIPVETALFPIFEALQRLQTVCIRKLATESPYHHLLAQSL